MRFAVVATSLALIGGAAAQLPVPLSAFGINLSSGCQNALLGLLASGDLATCASTQSLLPLVTANASFASAFDNLLVNTCYAQPCSQATLQNAVNVLSAGCQADIAAGTISNTTIPTAFGLYPLIREVLCLKTTRPYTAQSYGGFLGAPVVPITQYNSTGGYFCLTSFLTQLSAYFKTEVTLPFLYGIVGGQNTTAIQLFQTINPNILCNNCLFGVVDLISLQIPAIKSIPAAVLGYLLPAAKAAPPQTTLQQAFEGTCSYYPLFIQSNGTLPVSVSVAIVNSTFPFPVTAGPANGIGSL